MKERGTTGAGGPRIVGADRVHLHQKLVHRTHGSGRTGNDILLGQTMIRHSGTLPWTPRTTNHGSTVTGEAK